MLENRIITDFRKFLNDNIKCAESDIRKIVIGSEPGVYDYAITPYGENGKHCGNGGFMWLNLDLNEYEYTIHEMLGFFKWCYSNGYEVTFSLDEDVERRDSYVKKDTNYCIR